MNLKTLIPALLLGVVIFTGLGAAAPTVVVDIVDEEGEASNSTSVEIDEREWSYTISGNHTTNESYTNLSLNASTIEDSYEVSNVTVLVDGTEVSTNHTFDGDKVVVNVGQVGSGAEIDFRIDIKQVEGPVTIVDDSSYPVIADVDQSGEIDIFPVVDSWELLTTGSNEYNISGRNSKILMSVEQGQEVKFNRSNITVEPSLGYVDFTYERNRNWTNYTMDGHTGQVRVNDTRDPHTVVVEPNTHSISMNDVGIGDGEPDLVWDGPGDTSERITLTNMDPDDELIIVDEGGSVHDGSKVASSGEVSFVVDNPGTGYIQSVLDHSDIWSVNRRYFDAEEHLYESEFPDGTIREGDEVNIPVEITNHLDQPIIVNASKRTSWIEPETRRIDLQAGETRVVNITINTMDIGTGVHNGEIVFIDSERRRSVDVDIRIEVKDRLGTSEAPTMWVPVFGEIRQDYIVGGVAVSLVAILSGSTVLLRRRGDSEIAEEYW